MSQTIPPSDLTRRPPRSPRVRLGGYAILPRCLDKLRATLAGTNGEYHYACPLDRQFFDFAGIDPDALKTQATKDATDNDLLTWIRANAKQRRSDSEIAEWSRHQDSRGPGNIDGRAYFDSLHRAANPARDDITSWFDVLDMDDFVSFGGKA